MSQRRSRADRFLSAFRDIEQRLRTFVDEDPGARFDVGLSAVALTSSAIRRYQNKLRRDGWLRNAIVHTPHAGGRPVADPREDVVADIEAILRDIIEPPLLLGVFGRGVEIAQSDEGMLSAGSKSPSLAPGRR